MIRRLIILLLIVGCVFGDTIEYQNKIIDQLESDIERLKLEIFELKGDNKLLKMQLKECSTKLQEQQGYYDDDGNYVE